MKSKKSGQESKSKVKIQYEAQGNSISSSGNMSDASSKRSGGSSKYKVNPSRKSPNRGQLTLNVFKTKTGSSG